MMPSYPSSARGVMRFHLVYQGDLSSSGNSSPKPGGVLQIRRELSKQLAVLWQTHNSLKVLAQDGVIRRSATNRMGHNLTPRELVAKYPEEYEYLGGEMAVGSKRYTPLVRESLSLACGLKVLFLRKQDPGQLVTQGGDIDNRIKTLLDALRMPDRAEQDKTPPQEDHLYCLMQSDALVADLAVSTDRLLFPQTNGHHEVHLIIEVEIHVLQVGPHNVCLL
jgi:hypothetical protein